MESEFRTRLLRCTFCTPNGSTGLAAETWPQISKTDGFGRPPLQTQEKPKKAA